MEKAPKKWFPICGAEDRDDDGVLIEPPGVVPWEVGERAFKVYLAISRNPVCKTTSGAAYLGGFAYHEMHALLGKEWKKEFHVAETIYYIAVAEAKYFDFKEGK